MKRSLPVDYPVLNLGRRPARTLLTALACAMVAAVVAAAVAFGRGLSESLMSQGREDVAILLSTAAMRDVVRSGISPAVAELVEASVPGVLAASPEVHMGTNLRIGSAPGTGEADPEHAGFVRGVTARAFLVHEGVTLLEGRLPGPGEAIVGRLAALKLGVAEELLEPGRSLRIEGGEFEISGRFAAPGTTVESEVWVPMRELMGLARREDVSAVFVRTDSPDSVADVEVFARRRLDLELLCLPSRVYYGEMAAYFAPIGALAAAMAALIGIAVILTGANALSSAVQDRVGELATLRALGYTGAALSRALLLEALLLAAAGGLAGLLLARIALAGSAFRIGMGAFALEVDGLASLAGLGAVLLVGALGTLPAILRTLRLGVAAALEAP